MTRKYFEEDPEIEKQMQVLRGVASMLGRGDVLEYAPAEAALGLQRDEPRFEYLVKKWRRDKARDEKTETWPVPGVGVKLLTHLEQATMLPEKRAKKAYRQHGLILRSIQNTDLAKLPVHARRLAVAVADHSKAARREARKVGKYARGNVSSDRQKLLDRLNAEDIV
jgi:hypothetical protein